MKAFGINNWLALSTAVFSLSQSRYISIPNHSQTLAAPTQSLDLINYFTNKSMSTIRDVDPPSELKINIVFHLGEPLNIEPVYVVAVEAMYQLSLQPWGSSIAHNLAYHRQGYDAQIAIPSGFPPPPYHFPYSFAVSGLHEGVLYLDMWRPETSLPSAIRVDLLHRTWTFPEPVGFIEITHQASIRQAPVTRLSKAKQPRNATLYLPTNNAGEYTDPSDHRLTIRWRSQGRYIYSGDVYLAALDGIAMAARASADARCWHLSAKSSERASQNPVIMVLDSVGAEPPYIGTAPFFNAPCRCLGLFRLVSAANCASPAAGRIAHCAHPAK